jgi:hypothetical protein
VREQIEKEATVHIDRITQEFKQFMELYDRTANIWTGLEEDEKIHHMEKREDKLNIAVQNMKKRQKTMAISLRLKAAQDMKKLQEEVKEVQGEKQARQTQLEPLQQEAERMIEELQTEKGRLAQTHA